MPVPQERDFLQSLNAIKVLAESTCADKWDILIETALPAAGEALWLLIIPSPGEVLENYLQPRPRRGTPKRGKSGTGRRQATRYGQLRWWQKIGFPDIDQIIANQLPGRDLFEGRNAGKPEQWFWQGIDVIDRVLWYWLLIDMGRTFVVEWGSGIVESRFCTSSFLGLFSGSGTARPTATGNPWWSNPNQVLVSSNLGWDVLSDSRIRRVNPLINVSGQAIASISFTLTDDPTPLTTHTGMFLSFFNGSSHIKTVESDTIETVQGGSYELGLTADCDGFDRVYVQLFNKVGFPGLPISQRSWVLTVFANTD